MEPVSPVRVTHEIRDAQPENSPWPHVYKPSGAEGQFNLPPVVPPKPRPIMLEADLDQIKDGTREAILALITLSHRPPWPMIDVADFPSTRVLSLCVNSYFRHFHGTFPILHQSAFRAAAPADVSPLLLLSVAAIGAMYSRENLADLAVPLNQLARRIIRYLREKDEHAMFDVTVVQAWLLQCIFGLFCGSRMLYLDAELNRGGLVTAARRMHLLRPSLSYVDEYRKRNPTTTPEELARATVADEERRRLGWGIYLYDAQLSSLLNIASHFSLGEIDMFLPNDDNWSSAAPDSSSQLTPAQQPVNFRQALNALLSRGKLMQHLSSFSFSLIAHTLFRLCVDACAFDSILSPTWTPSDSPYRPVFPPHIQHNPQELLEQLSAECQTISLMPNALIVSVSALAHVGRIQFTWPRFLDNVKVAAGKSGTETSKSQARTWLSGHMAEDPVRTRSIIVHAGRLNALLLRFRFDSLSEMIWTFDLALTFWAMLRFGSSVVKTSVQSPRTIITWSESDELERYIHHGGSMLFQGLGDLVELDAAKVLAVFEERLEAMPWGIAQRFRHVLMNLDGEEDET
ncbi:hypothetical protein CALVIDRAFT_490418 [Calocera viscosa TUFC12733]|uniref:Xylanolytic transcriptional activator regulatory domain-containing protein n=1 Tax=Calocera viscosa (strain TUFC12733) TaxID=1330018 RepID=A0A167GE34_CALVF|nr:hypothetical protein CALVIDRAFT_490418 [Calocera viscosa TUFC12733]